MLRLIHISQHRFHNIVNYFKPKSTNFNPIIIIKKSQRYFATDVGSRHENEETVVDSVSSAKTGKVSQDPRLNPIGIQLLSQPLYEQVFGGNQVKESSKDVRDEIEKSLGKHGLKITDSTVLSDVDFELPELKGQDLDSHFRNLASEQTKTYRELGDHLSKCCLPPMPLIWEYTSGWTMYKDGVVSKVAAPLEDGLVFDIELVVGEGHYPTMATAASSKAWYSWCSERLIDENVKLKMSTRMDPNCLIPLELPGSEPREKVVVGHNVSFDRSFVKEQYYIDNGKTRFVDTMSFHIAVAGFTSHQRLLYNAAKSGGSGERKELTEMKERLEGARIEDEEWFITGSLNNLAAVHKNHCGGPDLKKEARDVFLKGTMTDVRENFQELMEYCANDVKATHEVHKKLWPEFFKRFQHPVTFAGMLEMGTAYLPVNYNWEKYIAESEATFNDFKRELKLLLMKAANDAVALVKNDQFKKDPWLWDLDWSTKDIKIKKPPKKTAKVLAAEKAEKEKKLTDEEKLQKVLDTSKSLYKTRPHMPGYPGWYRELCLKPNDENYIPGPSKISTATRATAKILRLTWDGYPLHYDETLGWGYLIPGRNDPKLEHLIMSGVNAEDVSAFPVKSLYKLFSKTVIEEAEKNKTSSDSDSPAAGSASTSHFTNNLNNLLMEITDESSDSLRDMLINLKRWKEENADSKTRDQIQKKKANWMKRRNLKVEDSGEKPFFHNGDGPYETTDNILGSWFFRIPHKDGTDKNVGNPLSKTFLNKIEDGTLKACSGEAARVLKLSKVCAYWNNNRDRIRKQMAVWLRKKDLPEAVKQSEDYDENGIYGAILPRVVTAGTVTRRAVEPTWMTASNAYSDRIGSELKAMIQAPPGYHFVGADVDSQELWIAAILGDSYHTKIHGSTAFGWMTLQGKKSDGSDLHSKTAQLMGISRDNAKVVNYSRIYGAGRPFAERLLVQFNHRLTPKEAEANVKKMFKATKGTRQFVTLDSGERKAKWAGGTESEMFNKLESIALSDEPKTPVLNCAISKSLESQSVKGYFKTSRVNWVVQSSAVDYLHLMLVSMRWMFDKYKISGRFCISIHDEVRYLVKSEDRFRAALALQITNLLTRSMFAHKLNMGDLPQSVAFFSAVDLDKCLRKEVNLDCVTPSNPRGLARGYSIPEGEACDIFDILKITNNGCLDPQEPNEPDVKDNTHDTHDIADEAAGAEDHAFHRAG
ncbi:DNA polymerase subunit gamma-1-like [Lineus longissimus]|uniref:DNA polymerase subunit gamma-1-like n=1 Tax=Lineus longissimus TaxID=88925 RepID=UPI00315DC2A2